MRQADVDIIFDLWDAPMPAERRPEVPHEFALPGLRIVSAPSGRCSLRYSSDWRMINVDLNAWSPVPFSMASDRETEIPPPLGGMLVLPAETELRVAAVNCRSDLVIEVAPDKLDALLGATRTGAPCPGPTRRA